MRTRLQQLFGSLTPWVLQPQRSLLLCGFAWLLCLPLSWQHPLLAFFAFSAFWGLTVAIWLEAPLLQSLPLPPLTVLLIGFSMRWGLGPLLLAFGGSGGDPFLEIWVRYGPHSQLLWLSLTVALLLLALFQRHAILRAASFQPQSSWLVQATKHPRLRAQLRNLATLLSIYMAAYIALSTFSGAFDRQSEIFLSWNQQLWRLDTPVAAFSRLRDLWFLLFPLWWRLLGWQWRSLLLVQILAFLSVALLSGSRGLLFYPSLLLFFGLWFVLRDLRLFRRFAFALAIMFLVLSPLIYVVRESPSFQRAQSLSGRIQAVGVSLQQTELLMARARWLGRDLYACHDPFLFTPEYVHQPPVGTRGLDRLLYIWVPKHFLPDQPAIFDGHVIAKHFQGVPPDRAWYPCFSFPADLMRRWAVPGVILGSLFISAVLQILLRLWYRSVSITGSTYQILLLLLPATYLQSFPFGTVSETAWFLLWELPKYLAVFWVLGTFLDRYFLPKEK